MKPQSSRRTPGLVKLIEDALNRPEHCPPQRLAHVADEYAAIAAHGKDHRDVADGRFIAAELRRGNRKVGKFGKAGTVTHV